MVSQNQIIARLDELDINCLKPFARELSRSMKKNGLSDFQLVLEELVNDTYIEETLAREGWLFVLHAKKRYSELQFQSALLSAVIRLRKNVKLKKRSRVS
jgi:hypothetical protein